ncbi:MAG TPA: Rieske 2Fe-2S domain-containing protein [Steroidobacteraceae bacterium]|nr:Rieske 2Fe-2S domain-containing protein [Steroidobacteraceae bacterium]
MAWQHHGLTCAPGSMLCALEAIPEGGCHELTLGSAPACLSVLLWRRQGSVRAYHNCCPHFSLPLNAHAGQFLLMGSHRLMCAWHCAVFDLHDGRCLEGPAKGMALESLPVAVVAGQVIRAEDA